MHVRCMPPMHRRGSFDARGSSKSILMLARRAACLLQVILHTALSTLYRAPAAVSQPQPMTGAEAAAPLPPANSTPKGSKRKGEQDPTSPQPVGWVDKEIPRLKHQCTPEQAVTLKAKSSLAIEQASFPPPKAQPAPGAAGEKRAHARNPEHPQRRLTEPEREACYLAYVIAAHRLGMPVPALGSKPELDDDVVTEALRIVRSTALVEGVPAAGSGKDSWLRHSQSHTLRSWVTRRITDGHVSDKYAGTQHAPKYPITDGELRAARDAICAAHVQSWPEAAAQPDVRAVLTEYGCGWAYLKAALLEFDPSLGLHLVALKAELSEATQQARVAYSKARLAAPFEELLQFVFIDQKKVYLSDLQGSHKVISSKNAEVQQPQVATFKPPRNNGAAGVIYVYIAVNAVLGPVHLYVGTGTHLRGSSLQGFKVSLSCPPSYTQQ
jgi:hypothetical protein